MTDRQAPAAATRRFPRHVLSSLRAMLAQGYFPTRMLDDGRLILWEHVSWSKAFPGVLPDVLRVLDPDWSL